MATAILTLALVRDESVPLETLAQQLGCTIDYAAGVIDAVEFNHFFGDGVIDWTEADEAAKAEYRAGLATGGMLLDEERGVPLLPVLPPVQALPVPVWDCPF